MSHFSVTVFGPPHKDALATCLQPWHEFECTGTDDEYVIEVDQTEELRKEFEEDTTRRWRDAAGVLHDPYDDKFYREPTPEEMTKGLYGSGFGGGISYLSKNWGDGLGYRPKVHMSLPDGMEEVTVKTSELVSFRQWLYDNYGRTAVPAGYKRIDRKLYDELIYKVVMNHPGTRELEERTKYGWTELDENGNVVRTVDRTNPNKKWDYWEVGGRWKNHLLLKNGTRADTALIREIDVDGMRLEAEQKALEVFGQFEHIRAGRTWEPWASVRSRMEIDEARDFYNGQEVVKDLKSFGEFGFGYDLDQHLGVDRDEWAARAAKAALPTFAFIIDNTWNERGSMGWWGIVSDEKNDGSYEEAFESALKSVPGNTMLWIVDCHI